MRLGKELRSRLPNVLYKKLKGYTVEFKITSIVIALLLSGLGFSPASAQTQNDVQIKLTCMPNVTCDADYCRRVQGEASGVLGGKNFTLKCNSDEDVVTDKTVINEANDSSWKVTLDSKPRSACNYTGAGFPVDVTCQVSSKRGVGALRLEMGLQAFAKCSQYLCKIR